MAIKIERSIIMSGPQVDTLQTICQLARKYLEERSKATWDRERRAKEVGLSMEEYERVTLLTYQVVKMSDDEEPDTDDVDLRST